MIAEQREYDGNDCIQELEAYLRKNYDYATVSNSEAEDSVKRDLFMKAYNHFMDNGVECNNEQLTRIVNDALEHFKNNWKNKMPGVDDRSGNLGKIFK